MRTIKILSIEDVKAGDVVTMKRGDATVKAPVGKNDAVSGPNLFVIYLDGFGTLYGRDGWMLAHATREVPDWEPGTVYEITTHDGGTMRAWCHRALDPDAWTAEECVTFVNRDGDEFLPGELKTATPRASVAEALRADLDAARTKVSDLTGRNAALEALVQEQKQGIQARDTWIEEQTADA